MKKILLTTALGLVAACSFAQGTIVFNNDVARAVTTNNASASGVVQTTMAPRAVVYYSTAAVAPVVPSLANNFDFAGWTLGTSTGFPTFFGAANSGRFAGGAVTLDTAVGGSSPWIIVAGWTGGFANWAAAYNAALAGNSLVGVTPSAWAQGTGAPNGAPPTSAIAMNLGASGFNGLVLTPVPEPSTFVLAGLGAAALMIFRRRK